MTPRAHPVTNSTPPLEMPVMLNVGVAERGGVHTIGFQISSSADAYTAFLSTDVVRRMTHQDWIDGLLALVAEVDKLNGTASGLITPPTRLEIPRS